MPIYRNSTDRISVSDAKQLILNALPAELGGARVIGRAGPDGETIWDVDSIAPVSAAEAHAPYLNSEFLALCKGLGFEPHMMFSPAIGGYSGNPEQDSSYMLTHAQLVKLAETYSLTVEIVTASPQAAPEAPAPKTHSDELPDPERRLIALRELGGAAKWKRGRDGVQAWQFTGMAKLVQQEKAQGRKRHDEKTIREDLREAAEAESMAKRNA